MLETDAQSSDERLCLDDLFVGQRFTSRTHVIDAAQIKAFARQFDPQPFHLDEDTAGQSAKPDAQSKERGRAGAHGQIDCPSSSE